MRKQTNSKVMAIFCSDLHLSLTPPPLRSAEPDWFAAMQRPVDELKALKQEHKCPIFCAGDVFDRWNAPAELINWAINHLPFMYCIPGQHDLPDHDLNQLERSAYWTLNQAKVIEDLGNLPRCFGNDMMIYPYPYGDKVVPVRRRTERFQIALIHQYNWMCGSSYKGAPEHQQISPTRNEFNGYDFVISGDNHHSFSCSIQPRQSWFVNCGAMMRRKTDDKFFPTYWLLYEEGKYLPYVLKSTGADRYLDITSAQEQEQGTSADLNKLIERLGRLGKDALNVRETFLRAFEGESKQRRLMLLKAMGE